MQIKQVLKQLGLSERHAAIYLACLELGSASVQMVSNKAGFARSTCEVVLKSLQGKGFVTSFQKKKARYFSPEEPKKLLEMAREKARVLEEALPQFSARYFRGGLLPTARVYEGETGAMHVFREILSEAKELSAFGSADDVVAAFPDFFQSFTKERVQKSIPLKLILQDSPLARDRQLSGPQQLREIRLMPKEYRYRGMTYLWQNKIAMFSFKEKVIAFVIESEDMATVQKAAFDYMWQSLPPAA